MKRNLYRSLFFLLIFAVVTSFAQSQNARGGGSTNNNKGLTYHGGRVMNGTTNVYFIWYGDWSGNSAEQILSELVATLGNSAYFRINTMYPDANGDTPSGGLVYSGAAYDLYSHGQSLDEATLESIVGDNLLAGRLPVDLRGVYVVFGAMDTDISHFVDGRCQFHDTFSVVGATLPYIFVPNSAHYPNACASQFVGANNQFLPTPNDNLGADAMANWLVHALSGAVTNPNGAGWFDANGLENTDRCQGMFGQTYLTSNGARANMNIGGRNFLMQQNWLNEKKGRCALSYP